MIAIGLAAGGGTDGLLVIYGAVIVAGLFTLLVAPFFSRLIKYFPPVVTGSVILIIGLALLPVAALDAVGGGEHPEPGNPRNLAYALGTLLLFPLIVCVRDVEKRDQVLRSGWSRMDNSEAQEHAAALIEIAKIANHRFEDLVADATPIASARTRRLHQLDG